ncbi:DUF397 domain-containing protein [Streptomyces genisteinicus]|uniref:DUF397 domain-containing protein n=1 Tax=Streptomyces genisteinicus TaxID=2768068 RepID=A0A7H0HU22_9ACTN|nr:DUF397 domain-containing protein [Streptomyces genisteinicus]QNP64038.1 DUF397 domain-containing protein [Streptomyces genisteinicus]
MQINPWQKSSYCAAGEACLNVSSDGSAVHLTESGDPDRVTLRTTPEGFDGLLDAIKNGGESPHISVSHTPDGLVRLTAPDADRPVVTTLSKWDAFVLGVRAGEFDHFRRAA